ncbi:hypothetical protein NAH39_10330, partial [Francisella tularensis subsp. holarctica]|uniref:hypothetical protein n=1 Tax=Francisella tularensis TaxID=263 RepID=UPI002381C4CD
QQHLMKQILKIKVQITKSVIPKNFKKLKTHSKNNEFCFLIFIIYIRSKFSLYLIITAIKH